MVLSVLIYGGKCGISAKGTYSSTLGAPSRLVRYIYGVTRRPCQVREIGVPHWGACISGAALRRQSTTLVYAALGQKDSTQRTLGVLEHEIVCVRDPEHGGRIAKARADGVPFLVASAWCFLASA